MLIGLVFTKIKQETLMIPIILDTDIGTDVDDVLALTFAACSPEIDILAVTIGKP